VQPETGIWGNKRGKEKRTAQDKIKRTGQDNMGDSNLENTYIFTLALSLSPQPLSGDDIGHLKMESGGSVLCVL